MSENRFSLLYFLRDKTFLIYPLTETSWDETCEQKLSAHGAQKKIEFTAEYDGVSEPVILVQLGLSEDELVPALQYARAIKNTKNSQSSRF